MIVALCALIRPVLFTQPVSTDPDDPAIWRNVARPAESRIIVTDKTARPDGGLYVFDLKGRQVQRIAGLDRPNNVDVEYGFPAGRARWDIAVATERNRRRLRIYRIYPRSGRLTDVSGQTGVFTPGVSDLNAPMGIGLYRTPNGRIHAFVSRKEHAGRDVIAEYRLELKAGRVNTSFVRFLGTAKGEVEAIFVDDELGKLYYAEEAVGYHRVDLASGREEVVFGRERYDGDREGIALYRTGPHTGWLVASEQRPDSTRYRVYRRENPTILEKIVETSMDDTDGLDLTSASLGPSYPSGMFVVMNSRAKNFGYFLPGFLPKE